MPAKASIKPTSAPMTLPFSAQCQRRELIPVTKPMKPKLICMCRLICGGSPPVLRLTSPMVSVPAIKSRKVVRAARFVWLN